MTNAPAKTDARWPVLAGLRFALAMVVVSGHLSWFTPDGRPLLLTPLGGTAAVLGFLVISGYSIGHSLHRRPAGFYRRRVIRIYPLYAAAVLYAVVPFWTGADALRVPGNTFARPTAWTVAGNLLLLQNVACRPIGSDNLVWTMGVEVAMYLLAPWLRRRSTAVVLVPTALSAAAFAAYPRMGLGHYETLLFGLPHALFAWAWLAGFLLHRSGTNLWCGLAIAVGAGVLTTVNHAFAQPYSVATVVASVVIVTLAGRVPVGAAARRGLDYLGDLSYPLYLFHFPTFLLGYAVFSIQSPAALLAAGVAVSAAALFVETTLRPVFARLVPRRAVPARPA